VRNYNYNNNYNNHINLVAEIDNYRNNHRYQKVVTENSQFSQIIKALFRKCQLAHHAKNWINLPDKISQHLHESFQMNKQPNPIPALSDLLN